MKMFDLCLYHLINKMRNRCGAMRRGNTKVLLHITAHSIQYLRFISNYKALKAKSQAIRSLK